MDDVDDEALAVQRPPQRPGEPDLVLDQQNPHRLHYTPRNCRSDAVLSDLTASGADTEAMSAIVQSEHTLLTEITTEIGTAEIAIWTITVGVCAIVAGTVLAYRTREVRYAALQVAGLLTLFALLAVHVHVGGWLTSADAGVADWLVAHRSPTLTTIARTATDLGSPAVIAAIALATAMIVGYRQRAVLPAITILATVVLAGAASSLTKIVVARARPPVALHLVAETDYSFPSGHVTGTVALLGVVLVVAPITRRWVRTVAVAAATAAWLLIATSRLYLGVHWLTDVLAGTVLATAVVIATTTALRSIGAVTPRLIATAAPRNTLRGPDDPGPRRGSDSAPRVGHNGHEQSHEVNMPISH